MHRVYIHLYVLLSDGVIIIIPTSYFDGKLYNKAAKVKCMSGESGCTAALFT